MKAPLVQIFAVALLCLSSQALAGKTIVKTKIGYVAALSEDDLNLAIRCLVDKDSIAFAKMMTDFRVFVWKKDFEVEIVETKLLKGDVKVRPKGSTDEVWTTLSALDTSTEDEPTGQKSH